MRHDHSWVSRPAASWFTARLFVESLASQRVWHIRRKRAIERKHHVGWRTVAAALDSAWPEPRKAYPQGRSKLDPFKPAIDKILQADLDALKKQRRTLTRLYARLIDEHAMTDVSYQVVHRCVTTHKPKISIGAGRGPAQVFIPQSHRLGAEAEVDFGEASVRLRGELVQVRLFSLRLSFSGKAVHRAFLYTGNGMAQSV